MSSPDRRHQLLVDELKQTVGEEAVERTDLDVDRALERQSSRLLGASSSTLLLVVAGAALVMVGVIASLAFENWLLLGVALAVHALLAVVVVRGALALSSETEKPAPTAEAALEQAGVENPSAALSDLVGQVADSEGTDSTGEGPRER